MLKVSIITVCYNSQKTIQETINSVNEQTYKFIEHIFIDGKSKDQTIDIIKKAFQQSKYCITVKMMFLSSTSFRLKDNC